MKKLPSLALNNSHSVYLVTTTQGSNPMTRTSKAATKKFVPAKRTATFDDIQATPVSMNALLDILTLVRIANSPAEHYLIDTYIMPLKPEVDAYGNLFLTIPDTKGESPTVAFTAHTDTVHSDFDFTPYYVSKAKNKPTRRTVTDVERQSIIVEENMLTLDPTSDEDCLGADDGTGVWIMLNLIAAKVPGLYCFYLDEESGRQGSEWSVANNPERYEGIDMMLSFDRKGTSDVITHQMGERCCSELFAQHISHAIDPEGGVKPDDTGSFTDSYSFLDVIPECTNICVGYYSQHTPRETQDLTWAAYLVNRLIAVDWNIVPVERDPTAIPVNDTTIDEIVETFPKDVAAVLQLYLGVTCEELVEMLSELNNETVTNFERRFEAEQEMDDFGYGFHKDFRL